MRKLASIRRILDLSPIEGADVIEVATVDGWKVVTKKGDFAVGDLCVYFEIDSFLPVIPMFEFLRQSSFKRMGDLEGFRLKTVKRRGQVSQGLIIPIDETLETEWSHTFLNFEGARPLQVGDDVTELLGVQKYEPPIPAQLAGQIRGNFPGFIQKTEQERCQNLVDEIFVDHKEEKYEVTIKLDGTSFTAYYRAEEVQHNATPPGGVGGQMAWAEIVERDGVCGRNWELKADDSNKDNSLVRMYIDSGLQEALRKFGKNYAVQGELMGPGIQKNREGFKSNRLYIFNVYDIDNACYVGPEGAAFFMMELWALGLSQEMVHYVPVEHMYVTLAELGITNLAELLAFAEGPSINHPIREGLVFKSEDGSFSFKVISNKFLLKEED